jgi:hypothetical protein
MYPCILDLAFTLSFCVKSRFEPFDVRNGACRTDIHAFRLSIAKITFHHDLKPRPDHSEGAGAETQAAQIAPPFIDPEMAKALITVNGPPWANLLARRIETLAACDRVMSQRLGINTHVCLFEGDFLFMLE